MKTQEDYSEFLNMTLKSKDYQYKYFDEKRKNEPIFKVKNDHWVITRYEDINTILRSNVFLRMSDPNENNPVRSLLDLDFENHSKYRKILNQVLNASLIKKINIEQKIENNFKKIQKKETIDVIKDIAVPTPLGFITEVLGAPMPDEEDMIALKNWTGTTFDTNGMHLTKTSYKQYLDNMENLCSYLINMIFSKKYKKQEGLINYLKNYYIDGQKLSNEEILSLCFLVFVAGLETTVGTISSSIYTVINNKNLIKNFQNLIIKDKVFQISDELVRHSSSVCYTGRRLSEDYIFYENSDNPIFIPQGDFVIAHLESGNRDDNVFENPHDLILNRYNSNKHLGFGTGAHYCLGALFAKAQVSLIVNYFFKNFKNIKIYDTPVRYPSYAINGFLELCVTVDQ